MVVLDGSVQIAPVFPLSHREAGADTSGFTTMFLITDDPLATYMAYVDQARAAGIDLAAVNHELCSTTETEAGEVKYVECAAGTPVEDNGSPPANRRLYLTLTWGRPLDEQHPASHMSMSYIDGISSPVTSPRPDPPPSLPEIEMPAVSDDDLDEPVPRGERDRTTWLATPQGTELVSSPLVTASETHAVYKVLGDPGKVWAAYVAERDATTEEQQLEGATFRYAFRGGAGAEQIARLVTTGWGSWLAVTWIDDP